MDVFSQSVFSVTKGERTYQLVVPANAPFGEAMDSCFEILNKLSDMQKTALSAMQQQPAAEPVPEPVA